MGLHEILETIRSEGENTAADLIDEAEAQAGRLLAEARGEATREERRLESSLDARIELERARVLSLSHLDAARSRRVAREQVFTAAIEAVKARLNEIRVSDRYEQLLESLLDEAVDAMGDGTIIKVDPKDVAPMTRVLASRNVDFDLQAEETPLGGLTLIAERRSVDNTLATRLARSDAQLRFVTGEIMPELRQVSQ